MRCTVLLPVLRPPYFLPNAIERVLAQTMREFELFVICDGAPPETIECAQEFALRDPRVTVFAFSKGERGGETHRLLGDCAAATSEYQNALTFEPDHRQAQRGLAIMRKALSRVRLRAAFGMLRSRRDV